MSYRLGIVIPARNEARRLPDTLAAIKEAVLDGVELRQILVIDNCSTDETPAVATRVAAELDLPLDVVGGPLPGKAGAVMLGVIALAEDTDLDGILMMDADNATDLGELRRFPLERAHDSILIGSRHLPGSEIVALSEHQPLARRFLSWGMRRLNRWVLGLRFSDTQCGFKLFPRSRVIPLFTRLRSRSWVFDAEILARAGQLGIPVEEIPVRWVEMPESKVRPIPAAFGSLFGLAQIRWWLWTDRS